MLEWSKQHRIYERKAYQIIQKHIKRILGNIPYQQATLPTYEYIVTSSILIQDIEKMFFEVYNTIGLNYGNKVNNELESTKKANILFNDYLLQQILLFLSKDGGVKIVSVHNTLIEDIIKKIQLSLGENATVIDLQNVIYKIVSRPNQFYKWQALRIARTESTSASNFAAMKTAEQSDLALDKVWISIQDNRTRRKPYDHLDMNNEKQELYKPFFVGGENIQYPGDIKASPGNVINCRCGVRYEPKRDLNGDLILKR